MFSCVLFVVFSLVATCLCLISLIWLNLFCLGLVLFGSWVSWFGRLFLIPILDIRPLSLKLRPCFVFFFSSGTPIVGDFCHCNFWGCPHFYNSFHFSLLLHLFIHSFSISYLRSLAFSRVLLIRHCIIHYQLIFFSLFSCISESCLQFETHLFLKILDHLAVIGLDSVVDSHFLLGLRAFTASYLPNIAFHFCSDGGL